jgi:hypothetical protein
VGPDDHLSATLETGHVPPEDILRFFDLDGQPVVVTSTALEHPDGDFGCAVDERVYDASTLPVGAYELVHFHDPTLGEPNNCIPRSCPWLDRDGRRALVADLVVSAEPVVP